MPDAHDEQPAAERAIVVQLSDDRLQAFVSVQAGPAAGEAELRRALDASGVRAGIDATVFARLALGLEDPSFAIAGELVARGKAMQQSQNGKFESPFLEGLAPGHVREDGTIDFHDRELLKSVPQGTALGRVTKPRAGVPGQLVDGTPRTPEPVSDATPELGPGAAMRADGEIHATRAGIVLCTPHQIDVVDRHVHDGAVDLRSGHLHMRGSLHVKGDVRGGFRVYATGDVEIAGEVDNGSVYAGGNARVRGGVRGGASASVCAELDLSVHHAESATLHAGRLLQIGQAVHTSLAAVRVEVAGKLHGGQASAEHCVLVREAGSPGGVATTITVAEPLELPVEAARRELEQAKAHRGLGATRPSRAPPGVRAKGGKIERARAVLQRSEVRRLAERARRQRELSSDAFVQITLAHPGVSVRIADQKHQFERETRAARLSLDPRTRSLRVDRKT
jgi:uncharacterized protein (DUF342 family)